MKPSGLIRERSSSPIAWRSAASAACRSLSPVAAFNRSTSCNVVQIGSAIRHSLASKCARAPLCLTAAGRPFGRVQRVSMRKSS
jgi:hypothetical protein